MSGQQHARPHFTPGKDPVPIVQEAGWALGQVWTGAENIVPTGIRSPDRPTPSQSLYRLSYPAIKHYAFLKAALVQDNWDASKILGDNNYVYNLLYIFAKKYFTPEISVQQLKIS